MGNWVKPRARGRAAGKEVKVVGYRQLAAAVVDEHRKFWSWPHTG